MTSSLEARAQALYYAQPGFNRRQWIELSDADQQFWLNKADGKHVGIDAPTAVTTSTHTIESSQQMNSADIINNISKLASIIGPDIVNADIRCYGDGGRVFKITATMKETA